MIKEKYLKISGCVAKVSGSLQIVFSICAFLFLSSATTLSQAQGLFPEEPDLRTLSREGGITIQQDIVASSPEEIEAEMRGVAERQEVPYLVVEVADAIGTWRGVLGRETVTGVVTMLYDGDGSLGDASANCAQTNVTGYRETYDFRIPAVRMIPPNQPARVASGDQIWLEQGGPGLEPTNPEPSPGWAMAFAGLYPHGLMHVIQHPDATIEVNEQSEPSTLTVSLGGQTFTATLDSEFRPARIATTVEHPEMGTTELAAEYSNYSTDIYGVTTPRSMMRKIGDCTVLDLKLTDTPTQNAYVIFPEPSLLQSAAN